MPLGVPGAGLPVVVARRGRVLLAYLQGGRSTRVRLVGHAHRGTAVDQAERGAGASDVALATGVGGVRVPEVVRRHSLGPQRSVEGRGAGRAWAGIVAAARRRSRRARRRRVSSVWCGAVSYSLPAAAKGQPTGVSRPTESAFVRVQGPCNSFAATLTMGVYSPISWAPSAAARTSLRTRTQTRERPSGRRRHRLTAAYEHLAPSPGGYDGCVKQSGGRPRGCRFTRRAASRSHLKSARKAASCPRSRSQPLPRSCCDREVSPGWRSWRSDVRRRPIRPLEVRWQSLPVCADRPPKKAGGCSRSHAVAALARRAASAEGDAPAGSGLTRLEGESPGILTGPYSSPREAGESEDPSRRRHVADGGDGSRIPLTCAAPGEVPRRPAVDRTVWSAPPPILAQ